MPKRRSDLQLAIGKLIVSVQQAWNDEIGLPEDEETLSVMYRCHSLLQAATVSDLTDFLKGRTVASYVGGLWLGSHLETVPFVDAVAAAMTKASRK
jgi:hypothetical protein